jgi:hypothetical protein
MTKFVKRGKTIFGQPMQQFMVGYIIFHFFSMQKKQKARATGKKRSTTMGLEPTISRSGGERLIH